MSVWASLVLAQQTSFSLTSPDERLCVEVSQGQYTLRYADQTVIERSEMGLEMDNRNWERALAIHLEQKPWMQGMQVDSVSSVTTVNNVWNPLWGERAEVRDHYRTSTLYLSRHDGSDYRLNIELRAYDEGLAFRYFLPEHPRAIFHKITADLTTYRLPRDTRVWSNAWAQSPVVEQCVEDMTEPAEKALTMRLPSGLWCSLLSADVDDWCHEQLEYRQGQLHTRMWSPVEAVTYFASPWKIILVGEKATDLANRRYLVENLNPDNQIADATQWVRPGTIMRCTTMTTQGGKECIDFCQKHHIPYMLFDWKWYMPCASHDGDATQVVPEIDMPLLVQYARERGVGIWLYVNQHALMKQADELFPLLHQWGIVGVKSGFVEYASHRWATWLHDLVRLAAKIHLLMNIHDEFRPSGFSRTYPNLLTQEGIRGNEEWPDATENTMLPFTRMLNGAADYTICYFDKRLKNTHAHQLAASLTYYSPLTTILWYDKPGMCHDEPEMEWFETLPTTWDESKLLAGEPGKSVLQMRRLGDTYYLALMGNNEGGSEAVSLDFLPQGKRYIARLYEDDPSVKTATQVRITDRKVNSRTALKLNLLPRGGAVIKLTPASK